MSGKSSNWLAGVHYKLPGVGDEVAGWKIRGSWVVGEVAGGRQVRGVPAELGNAASV
jgi:hypothetical protein